MAPLVPVHIMAEDLVRFFNAELKQDLTPIRVGSPARWQTIRPTTEWQTMLTQPAILRCASATRSRSRSPSFQ